MAFYSRLIGALVGVSVFGYAALSGAQEAPGVTKDEILFGSWTDLSGGLVSYGVPGVAGQSACGIRRAGICDVAWRKHWSILPMR
ncbi:hypothetical protein [Aquamicrobium sp.]|uniref:hypothetical protein n=1 Tax=Aquamicrobium sp. TaxID=1872579 RepID=UPI00258CE9DE|nr:hypothetical protein [Aquamicrobium sp.]MCK9553563.1 hypothetical protein [Aquamicrobium sp.]